MKILRMTSLLGCLLLLTISFGASSALGGTTYYVHPEGSDTNPGTKELPWKTIQHAAEQVKEGDTVLIYPGTYPVTQNILISRSGEEGNPITFKGYGSGVVVDGSFLDGSHYTRRDTIFIDGADYIIIESLEIKNAYRAGIRISLSNHVTIRNVTSYDNGKWGIFTDFSNYLLLENNECYGSREQHGIYVSNSGDYPTVRGNVIHDNHACGLHMNGDISMGGDGIISHALVENNIIYNNGFGGCSGINCDGVTDSVIRNNLLYDTHASGISLYRIDGGTQSNNNTVYHNTIIIASDGRWAINLKNGSSRNKIYNNILLTEHSWRGSIAADSIEGLESDYNVFTTNAKAVTPDDDASYLTFQEWQALGYDQHSIQATIEEVFVDRSQNNYHLNDYSPCIGAGIMTPDAPDTDIEGKRRPNPPGSNPDMGAYEHFREAPLAVTLASLTASSTTDSITLKWRTATETNNLGFNIYRSDAKDGKYIKVNSKLIQGSGTDATPHDYSFTDDNVKFGQIYYYYIEDVDFSGKKGRSPILQITVGKDSEVKVIDKSNITVRSKLKPVVIPTEFALLQNFPNPFNPSTWIPYYLPQNADVTIFLYNANGQLVRTLSVGVRSIGAYVTKESAAYWDGRDSFGQQVASGVYFYTLQAGEFSATRKMVILK